MVRAHQHPFRPLAGIAPAKRRPRPTALALQHVAGRRDWGVPGADIRPVRRQGDGSHVRSLPGPPACCAAV